MRLRVQVKEKLELKMREQKLGFESQMAKMEDNLEVRV